MRAVTEPFGELSLSYYSLNMLLEGKCVLKTSLLISSSKKLFLLSFEGAFIFLKRIFTSLLLETTIKLD